MVNKSHQTQCQLLRYIVCKPITLIFKYKQKKLKVKSAVRLIDLVINLTMQIDPSNN